MLECTCTVCIDEDEDSGYMNPTVILYFNVMDSTVTSTHLGREASPRSHLNPASTQTAVSVNRITFLWLLPLYFVSSQSPSPGDPSFEDLLRHQTPFICRPIYSPTFCRGRLQLWHVGRSKEGLYEWRRPRQSSNTLCARTSDWLHSVRLSPRFHSTHEMISEDYNPIL